jgi:dTDP-glucose pyrophosphorylase
LLNLSNSILARGLSQDAVLLSFAEITRGRSGLFHFCGRAFFFGNEERAMGPRAARSPPGAVIGRRDLARMNPSKAGFPPFLSRRLFTHRCRGETNAMRILIAMAGLGTRSSAEVPKPLVPVADRPMISWALDSLVNMEFSQLVLTLRAAHEEEYGLSDKLRAIHHPLLDDWSRIRIIFQRASPSGQLTSVLEARDFLQTDEDLLIASVDTFIVSSLHRDIAERARACRGIVSVVDKPGEQWSFVRTEPGTRRVIEVAEKVRISDYASTGMYYFSSSREFVEAADEVVRRKEKQRGEYYVSSVYGEYIKRNWSVEISTPAEEMWDLGTPAARSDFLAWLRKHPRGEGE